MIQQAHSPLCGHWTPLPVPARSLVSGGRPPDTSERSLVVTGRYSCDLIWQVNTGDGSETGSHEELLVYTPLPFLLMDDWSGLDPRCSYGSTYTISNQIHCLHAVSFKETTSALAVIIGISWLSPLAYGDKMELRTVMIGLALFWLWSPRCCSPCSLRSSDQNLGLLVWDFFFQWLSVKLLQPLHTIFKCP